MDTLDDNLKLYGVKMVIGYVLHSAYTGDLDPFRAMKEDFKEDEDCFLTGLEMRAMNGRTPLHFAASGGKKSVCKFILEEGKAKIDVDTRDWEAGETPLHLAVRAGRFKAVGFLLDHGADPNDKTRKRRTSLHYAVEQGSKKIALLLISKGAEVNVVADDCGTPLIIAAGKGSDESIMLLLGHHADPNATYRDLFSPLMATICAQSLECMELLLKAGADPNFCGFKGVTPLGYAASEGLIELVNCLLKAGADPNATNNLGLKPLEEAALKDQRQVVRILFPLTSPIPTIPRWSIPGLLKRVNSNKSREEAISTNPSDAAAFSERSLCWSRMNEGELAFEDAEACIKLRPNWSEGHYRAGSAKMLLNEFKLAAERFVHSLSLDPENKAYHRALREANEARMLQISKVEG